MPRHSPTRDDREETASPAFTRLLFIAMGIAMLIGLISGVVWTIYHLVRGYLLD
jgi:hypothetical protein